MEHRKLGSSGTIVTNYCLGAMTFGWQTDEKTSHQLIEDYVAAGGNFIDTANVYTNGASEEILGRWLKANPEKAAKLVITTKGRFPMGDGANQQGLSRKHLSEALDASLSRLQMENIDLYQMHGWDALTPIDETLRFLDDSISAGKISYYGFSNYLGWQITKAVHRAVALGFTPPVTLQPQYNLLARDIEHEVIPACADANMGILPWSPLGGGWLAGKYKKGVRPTGATRLGENPDSGMEAFNVRNGMKLTWNVIDAITEIAPKHNASPAQVSLAWLVQRPQVTSVILGARTREQLADNLSAVDIELSDAEISQLTEVSNPDVPDYPYGEKGTAQRHRKLEGGR